MAGSREIVTHLVYRPDTGAVVGRFRHHAREQPCDCDRRPDLLDRLGGEVEVELLDADPDEDVLRGRAAVDPADKHLARAPRLMLDLERTELDGDGEDDVEIELRVVDGGGAVVSDFDGEVKVRVSRGRLSSRGGVVRMEGGRGRITLTSVPETIERVGIQARSLDHAAVAAQTTIAFR